MSIKSDGKVKYSVEGLSYENIEHAIIVGKRMAARYNRLVPMFDNIPDGDFDGDIVAIFGPKGEQFTTFPEARLKYPNLE